MYLPRPSTIFSITILAFFLSSGNAQRQEGEQPVEDNSSNNLRGGGASTEQRSLVGRFLQIFDEGGPAFAFSTSCYTSCIAATSNSCRDTPTPFFCRRRPPVSENAIGVRNECFQSGFVFYADEDTNVRGANMGPYRDLDMDELAQQCYYIHGRICTGFSTTGYMKVKDIDPETDLKDYEGGEELPCRGFYLKE